MDCKSLTTVDINQVYIFAQAFSGCTSLQEVTGYGSTAQITAIKDSAFLNCTALKTITPRVYNHWNRTEIGIKAFYGCKNLKSINLLWVNDIGDSAFYNCKSLESVNILNASGLNKGAFSGSGLIRVTLPTYHYYIPEGCFSNCTNLIQVNFMNVKTIGKSAFYNTQLSSVKLPTTIKTIYDNAFGKCNKLYEVYCPVSTPPTISSTFSDYVILGRTTLYVPNKSESQYWAANGWNEFGRIVGADLSGIDNAKADMVAVKAGNGTIEVTGTADGTPVAVYSINGSLVRHGSGGQAIDVPAGIYIVKVGGQAFKTVVR